ncbi:putative RNA helicase [Rosa chinensis]|uniref:Putative RNA helicase n=1 Tax=Rosa chinensis TaxID=74649 RepID=A0A2P6Q896_ROSCH|nr:DEAD-box ATP-dependent RNA helicase 36 [Rosa chinensis]PRQ30402.1 putative RNA helicase [Rosa chinensis]
MDGEEEEATVSLDFPLFKPRSSKPAPKPDPDPITHAAAEPDLERSTDPDANSDAKFTDLGLADWLLRTVAELGLKKPTPVQANCIPKILEGRDVLGLAQTGSGKTAAFALPILQRLAEGPYGVFALVMTPTHELAYQLAEQFRAFGSSLHLRCSVIVGGMDKLKQAQSLMSRPHVVIATPGRVRDLLQEDPDFPSVFSKAKFLVLDEADRLLNAEFEADLRVVFQCLPKNRQTLLFSATMTSDLQALIEVSANKAYFYQAYEGLRTVGTLAQKYVFIPREAKEVYLVYILSKMKDMGIRSAIVFVSTLWNCHLLNFLLEELGQSVSALHSSKSQPLRLSALHKFKSGQVPVLIATDLANRGLDIPTVDLVINYDIPSDPKDYVHRVGRTARAGRGGLAVSVVTQLDVKLLHKIEEEVGEQLVEFECKENEVLEDIRKVYTARRVAKMKMMESNFVEREKKRKERTLKTLEAKGLLKKRSKKNKRELAPV